MKWTGQHIYDLVSRFRNDVYLEDIPTSTETDMLVVDSSGKVSKRAIDAITVDVSDFMTNGVDNRVLTATGTDAINAEANLTFDGSLLDVTGSLDVSGTISGTLDTASQPNITTLTGVTALGGDGTILSVYSDYIVASNTTASTPSLQLTNQTNDATGPNIILQSYRLNPAIVDGQDGDVLGTIYFNGYDDGTPSTQSYAWIRGKIADATSGQEAGELTFNVAEYDGSITTGLKIDGDTDANGEVDVTIGAGAASDTTIAGNLIVTSDLTVSGTTTTINTTNLNVEDKNITLNYNDSSDTSSTADGAGITIQDAVDASNDASLTWTAADDTFEFSHAVEINNGASSSTPALTIDNDVTGRHALFVDAANTTAHAVRVDAKAVAAKAGVFIDCDALTTGNALLIDVDDALTTSNTKSLAKINYDKSGVIGATATADITGLEIALNDDATNHSLGASNLKGIDVKIDYDNGTGAQRPVGVKIEVAKDGVIDALNGRGTGWETTVNDNGLDFKCYSSANDHVVTGDFASWATSTNGATTIKTVDYDAALAHFEIEADGNITLDAAGDIALQAGGYDITGDARDYTFTNEYSGKPLLTLKATNTSKATSSELKFLKDAADVEDAEQLGKIGFYGDNDAGTPEEIQYGAIIGIAADMTDGQEAGTLLFQVAEYDGTLTTGLKLDGDTDANGEIDVNIGVGAASVTTIAGTLTMGSTATLDNSGILQTAAQTNITSLGTLTNLQVDYINANASTLTITDSSDTGDLFSIATTTHGATTITTTDDDAHAADLTFVVDGFTKFDSADTTGGGVEIENGSASGNAALLIDNDDIDQFALSIDAENTTNHVISVDASPLTSGHALNIDCSSLTTGSAIKVDNDDSETSGYVIKKLVDIDYDKSGVTGAGALNYTTGLNISLIDSATNDLNGLVKQNGIVISCDAASDQGGIAQTGVDVALTDADTGYITPSATVGYKSKVENGGIDFLAVSSADNADYFTMQTGANGVTTLTTVDGTGGNDGAHFEVATEGDITLDANGDIKLEPASGSSILLDGTIDVDAGVVTGATSITSTAFVGTLSTAAQPNVTSLGTLTALDVDDINLNAKTITITGDTSDTFTITTGAAGATTLTTTDGGGTAGHFEVAANGDITLDADGNIALETADAVTSDAGAFTISNGSGNRPELKLQSKADDATCAKFTFDKNRFLGAGEEPGAGISNGDDLGIIQWTGTNQVSQLINYANILAEISEMADTDEAGKLTFNVAASNGSTSALVPGLILEGEHATSGEVDVTIGNKDTSLTTVSGLLTVTSGLTMGSTSTLNSSGVLQVAAQTNITSVGTLTGLTTSGAIELGHASDTTVARSAAGTVTIEGNQVVTAGVATGNTFHVPIKQYISLYMFYMNIQNYWYTPPMYNQQPHTNAAIDGSTIGAAFQARMANYIATSACKVKKVTIVFNQASSYLSGDIDLEFALVKYTPPDDTANQASFTKMTITDHDGAYTENDIHTLTFTVTDNAAAALAEKDCLAFCARTTTAPSSGTTVRNLVYGSGTFEIELT